MDTASKATLENEFGTHNDEEVIKLILEKGTLQETEVRILLPIPHPPNHSPPFHPLPIPRYQPNANSIPSQAAERQGTKNDSMGSRAAH